MNKIFKAINIINEDYCNRRGIDWKPVTNPLDPDYCTKDDEERAARVSEEVERLMSNPEEIEKINQDRITEEVKIWRNSALHLGVEIEKYYREVAEKQAEDTI